MHRGFPFFLNISRTLTGFGIPIRIAILAMCMLSMSPRSEIVFPPGAVIKVTDGFGYIANQPATHGPAIQAAIRAALDESFYPGIGVYVYLPNGTYHIDSTLTATTALGNWAAGLFLVGQSREGTIIKLKDTSLKFQNPAAPLGMVKTAGYSYAENGNSGFNNFIMNMTLDAGKDNPGACGVDFIGNNVSGIQNVTIRSQLSGNRRAGVAGIWMERRSSGPGLVKDVLIEGFDFGVQYGSDEAIHEAMSMTFERLTVRHQNSAGVAVGRPMISIRGFQSENSVPALQVNGQNGMAFVSGANLTGGAAGNSAIATARHLFARDVATSGYQTAISVGGVLQLGTGHVEFLSSPATSLFPSPATSLRLPVREVPGYWDTNLANWQKVGEPSPGNVDDAAVINQSIQDAIQGGKTTLWFPAKRVYVIKSAINLQGNIKHIVGMGTILLPDSLITSSNPMIRFGGLAGPLKVEHLNIGNHLLFRPNAVAFRHESPQTVIFSQILLMENSALATAYEASAGAGDVFIENCGGSGMARWHFTEGQHVWATQWNVEGVEYLIKNSGADLWIHGLKTEMTGTVIETKKQGRTELLGGLLKGTFHTPTVPAFINEGSSVSLGYVDNPTVDPQFCPGSNTCAYPIQVKEIRGGVTLSKQAPNGPRLNDGGAEYGTVCPLYVGYPIPVDYPERPSPPILDASHHRHLALVGTSIPLLMDGTEVIQDGYAKVMAGLAGASQFPSSNPELAGPVESVTFFDAILYCNRRSDLEGLQRVYSYTSYTLNPSGRCMGMAGLTQDPGRDGYRLPLEGEWTAAYLSGATTSTYWGQADTDLYAWHAGNSPACRPSVAGTKYPNSLGLQDMAGNVAEWVWTDDPSSGTAMGGFYSSVGNQALGYDAKIIAQKNSYGMNIGFRPVRKAPIRVIGLSGF